MSLERYEEKLKRGFESNCLPDHMWEGIKNYVLYGILPGSFLEALLCNNLIESINRADHINEHCLKEWAHFLYWELPSNCWGNSEKILNWIDEGGLELSVDVKEQKSLPEES